jgi:UDP-galactopyranose mutase
MVFSDVLCFSHARWTSAMERPGQLMARCAQHHRVFFVEEPIIDATYTEITKVAPNLWRVVPHLGEGKSDQELLSLWREQLLLLRAERSIERPILWYYTPAAIAVSRHLPRVLTVYDCTRDLATSGAPPELLACERELIAQSDLVFVTGHALYAQKCNQHPRVYNVPSGIDLSYFARARQKAPIPADQAPIPGPRIGYCGVIDQRIDWRLVREIAELRPKWQFVFLGPVAPRTRVHLPALRNVHYLGAKSQQEVLEYVSDWDAAMIPFVVDEVTRTLSPNKTLECLAAGKEIVATPLPDVVEPFARMGLLQVASDAEGFVCALEAALRGDVRASPALRDAYLAQRSWSSAFQRIHGLVMSALAARGVGVSAAEVSPP